MVGGAVAILSTGGGSWKPCRGSLFGDFECEIKLHKCYIMPHQDIEGSVEIKTIQEIKHHGLRVQLEATISLYYEAKIDNRSSYYRKARNLLADSSEQEYYTFSPVRHQIIGVADKDDDSCRTASYIISPGSHSYPFKMRMTGENLPTPFQNQYGSLRYRVKVYLRANPCYVSLSEESVRFRGHLNLNEVPGLLDPLKCDTGFYTSLFSKKKFMTASFEVAKKGFLSGEDTMFHIKILNPKLYEVKRFSVFLTRKITYNIDRAMKRTVLQLNRFEILEATKDVEINWKGKVNIPVNSIPSYSVKQIYNVTYHLEYEVEVAEHSRPLKGHVEIVVGTTRDTIHKLLTRRMTVSHFPDYPEGIRERSHSIVSSLSDSLVMTEPPNYSQLSSRASSRLSLATLPPHYDDLTFKGGD